jgi:hypothetical protein
LDLTRDLIVSAFTPRKTQEIERRISDDNYFAENIHKKFFDNDE